MELGLYRPLVPLRTAGQPQNMHSRTKHIIPSLDPLVTKKKVDTNRVAPV